MTKDETWRKKQLKVSVSGSVWLRRLFQMTINDLSLGGCCILRQTASGPHLVMA